MNINFDTLYETLKKYIGNDNNFSRVMNIIFINEFKKSDDKEFRIKLMTILLSNKKFIYDWSYLIELILGDYLSYDVEKFKDNINNIQYCGLIEFLNQHCDGNEILEEMLINCFEFHINLYFKEIEKKFKNRGDFNNYFFKEVMRKSSQLAIFSRIQLTY